MKDCLSIEDKVRDLLKYRRERRGRIPERSGGHSRCDMVIWHANKDGPRVIIEVKRQATDCANDIKRLKSLMNGIPLLKFCIIATCLYKRVVRNSNAEGNLIQDVNTIYKNHSRKFSGNGIGIRKEPHSLHIEPITIPIYEKTTREEDWVWCPVCFVIYRK